MILLRTKPYVRLSGEGQLRTRTPISSVIEGHPCILHDCTQTESGIEEAIHIISIDRLHACVYE